VDWIFKQLFYFGGWHIDKFLGKFENLPHTDAHKNIALAVLTYARLELAQILFGVFRRPIDF